MKKVFVTISNMGTLDTNQSAMIRSEVGPKEIGKKARTYRSKGGFNEVKSAWAVFSLFAYSSTLLKENSMMSYRFAKVSSEVLWCENDVE